MKKATYIMVLALPITFCFAQGGFVHINNTSIYNFLDELTSEQIIEINTFSKPYSRIFISRCLKIAADNKDKLNQRQKNELEFYLLDYGKQFQSNKNFNRRKDLFYYKDSLFSLTLNPILSGALFVNTTKNILQFSTGAEVYGTIANHIEYYARLKDYHDNTVLVTPDYLVQNMGARYADGMFKGFNDYSEMTGGVTYNWKWGNLGIYKDHFMWGNNYNGSNIFSGRTPSFAFLNLKVIPVKWLELNYIHGWLISDVVDSLKTYQILNGSRTVMKEKYLACNAITFKPIRNFYITSGNSIVYSDIGLHPAYLIPFLFYKSVDHAISSTTGNNGGQNAQMYLDISSRQIKKVHLYTTLFIDEISFGKVFNKEKQSNWLSWKSGFRLSNLLDKNIFLTAEYTRTNPFTYTHYISTITFESNQYNLGHYLKDNAREYHFSASWLPLQNLKTSISYTIADAGPQYPNTGGYSGLGLPFLNKIEWHKNSFNFVVQYQLINDLFFNLEYEFSDVSGDSVKVYTPQVFQGKNNTIKIGFNFGY